MLLPLIHSEEISDHEMAYYLLNKYLREHEEYNKIKKFWQDHTKAIRLFHRYPHRNEILGRESTEEEKECYFLDEAKEMMGDKEGKDWDKEDKDWDKEDKIGIKKVKMSGNLKKISKPI